MIRRYVFLCTVCFCFAQMATAQKKWDLRACVEYAMANHPSVAQAEIQSRISALTLRQNQLSRFPSLNLGMNSAFNSGNNQDPITFSRVTENYLVAGLQLQSSADIFNFFSRRNAIAASEWDLLSARANADKVRYDLALSTSNAYLQVLLTREQINIAGVQILQTTHQLDNTRKMVNAGTLPELNLTQLEAQLALDSSNYIASQGNFRQALLGLQSLMSLDPALPFEVDTPPLDSIPVEALGDLQPEYVYQQALKNQPQQIGNAYRIQSALKSMASARAARYPTLSVFATLGSNYLSFSKQALYDRVVTGYQPTGLIVDAGSGVLYNVQSPIYTNGAVLGYVRPDAFFTQLNNNFRKSVGLTLNVPLFNGGQARIAYERSRLTLGSAQVQQQQDDQKLKQDIYQAHQAAVTAWQRFQASEKSVRAGEKTYDFASKRFAIGALSTFDLITSQNNLLRSRLEYTINRFDFVFKMKVLEFYKGEGLKL